MHNITCLGESGDDIQFLSAGALAAAVPLLGDNFFQNHVCHLVYSYCLSMFQLVYINPSSLLFFPTQCTFRCLVGHGIGCFLNHFHKMLSIQNEVWELQDHTWECSWTVRCSCKYTSPSLFSQIFVCSVTDFFILTLLFFFGQNWEYSS